MQSGKRALLEEKMWPPEASPLVREPKAVATAGSDCGIIGARICTWTVTDIDVQPMEMLESIFWPITEFRARASKGGE
ncbi:hypothetical protein V7S43_007475 [Phytophthora oleae]|uniref:Uncharacterized protein n=1 Tax=Phytophthora oleae TaxID=2107226 RepID=A0ABD3FNC4_9STRA